MNIVYCNFTTSKRSKLARLKGDIPQMFNNDTSPCVEVNQYLRQLALKNKPKSLQTNAEHLKEFLLWANSSLNNIGSITDDTFDFYIDALCEYTKNNGERLSWNTINSRVAGAYRYLIWSYEKGLSPYLNPQEIKGLKLSLSQRYQSKGHHSHAVSEPIKFMLLEDALRFVSSVGKISGKRNALVKKRNVLLTSFMLQTGLRVSEACNFPLRDLPEVNSRGKFTPARVIGKGGKARVILIPNDLLYQIWEYVDIDREKKIDAITHIDPKDCLTLFITQDGQPLSINWVQKLFRKTSKHIGVKAHPHLLRHTFGTYHYLLNHDLTGLSKLLGHASEETTRTYYVHTATLIAYSGSYNAFQRQIDIVTEDSISDN